METPSILVVQRWCCARSLRLPDRSGQHRGPAGRPDDRCIREYANHSHGHDHYDSCSVDDNQRATIHGADNEPDRYATARDVDERCGCAPACGKHDARLHHSHRCFGAT